MKQTIPRIIAAEYHASTIQQEAQTTNCLLAYQDQIMHKPEQQSCPRRHEVVPNLLLKSVDNAHATIMKESINTMEVNGSTSIEKDSANATEYLFCGSSFDEDAISMQASSSGLKSSNINFLDSNQQITEILEDDLHDNSFSLMLEESSSDEMSNIGSEISCTEKNNVDNNPESFDHCNIDMNPLGKSSEYLIELNTCSEVAENIIRPKMSVSENIHRCGSQSMLLNCDNMQVVESCGKSPIPELTNTINEICRHKVVKTNSRIQTNIISGSEKMASPATAAFKKMKLDNNSVRTSSTVASQLEEKVRTLGETNDTCGTVATDMEFDKMMEHDRIPGTSFEPYKESELNDLDLEFVSFGLPSPGECIMSQERTPISRHETQASILEGPERKCDALKKMEGYPTRLSFGHDQKKSLPPTTRTNQKLQDSESVEDQKSGNVGCTKVDNHLVAKCRDEHNDNKSLCYKDIPNGQYCLINHNLYFFANGCKISLQFDNKDEFFTCPFCSVSALNNETIGQHILDHTSDNELRCLLGCSDVFVTMKKMVDHLNSHKENEVYRCGACQSTFPTVALIKSHVAIRHEPDTLKKHKINKKFMCSKCGLRFSLENNLYLHTLTNCSSGKDSCSLSELHFQLASRVSKHAASHRTQRPYCCKLCTYASDNRCDLHFHLNQHRNDHLPHTCPECSVVCPNKDSYLAHVLEMHCKGILSCVCCKHCDFTSGHHLMMHMRAHEAHGWTEDKVPGLGLMLSLQVVAAERQKPDEDDDNNTITVTDCGGVRLQFTPDNYLSGEEHDLVSFEMNIA